MSIETITKEILAGKKISREEALWLYEQPLEELSYYANLIREHFCSNDSDLCTIINAKSGQCSENCKFCAQSSHNVTDVEIYPLLSVDQILAQAKIHDEQGILRYSLVTSGKRLTDKEVDLMCDAVRRIKEETSLSVCISFGLLNEQQYRKLKEAGVSRVHNNLETSRRNFPNLCTTHSFEDKVNSIRAAQSAGLSLCSGGIMGLGESLEDRIDMAFSLRDLGIKSVPLNLLNPIPGTPLENVERLQEEDFQRIVALYRFILPDASIRLAGGRGLLSDGGRACFASGANAAITGDMLTTVGITVATDKQLIEELGYKVGFSHE